MKKPILIIFMLISSYTYAQFYEDWTEPYAITDSLSINTNPDVLADTDILDGDVVVFYEKEISSNSTTQVWMRNLSTMEDEQEVLGAENKDFRNPKLLVFSPYYDTRCFIIYESNESGNFNIYGIEFFEDGSFGSSFQLTNTPEDENSCFVVDFYGNSSACWEANNNIHYSAISFSQDTIQFDEIVTIDTNFCFEPVCSDNIVFWRKMINDSSHIYYSENVASGQWTNPLALYSSGNNTNLQMFSQMLYGFLEEEFLIWENDGQALTWSYWSQEVSALEFQGVNSYYEPSGFIFDILTEKWIPAIYSFCSGENESKEVYAVIEEFSNEAINISNNFHIDSYPKLFMGKWGVNYFNTLNIWQSEVNNNSVLYLSQISILIGGSEEINSNNKLSLHLSPNPFKEKVEIEYYLNEKGSATIEILSLRGNQLLKRNIKAVANSWQSFTWNPNNEELNFSKGNYFVKLTQGASSIVRKVVYSK